MSVCSFPLQLCRPTRPDDAHDSPNPPVRYAYCLLDLAAEQGNHPGRVFLADRHIFTNRRMSGEVVWQLACRTNGQGFLVPCATHAPQDPEYFLRNDAATRRRIDTTPCLQVRPGMRFNLYWTYDRDLFEKARDPDRTTLVQEHLLHRCSTYFAEEDRSHVQAMLESFAPIQGLHTGHGDDGGWRTYMQDRFFRPTWGDDRYRRTLARPTAQRTFYIQPEDDDLYRAMDIARKIELLVRVPKEHEVMEEVNAIYHVIDTIDRYQETPPSLRDVRSDINTIMSDAILERRSFGRLRGNLIQALWNINRAIELCGERLAPLLENALLQACSHYERDVAQRFTAHLMNAMGIALARQFHDDFLSDPSHFRSRTQAASQNGVSTDALGTFIRCFTLLNDTGVFSAIDLVDKTTEWLDALIAPLTSTDAPQIAGTLNRLNQFLHNIQDPAQASGTAPSILQVYEGDVRLSVQGPAGQTLHFDVRRALNRTHSVLQKVGALVSFVNYWFAFRDLNQDQSFKNYLSAFSSTAEASLALLELKTPLNRLLGITEAQIQSFSRSVGAIGGMTTIVVAGIDATDHLAEGNNVAAIGNTVQALGGVLSFTMGATAGAGVVIALIVVAGAVIVHWSLTPDARDVQNFRQNHRARIYSHLDEFNRTLLDPMDSALSIWDRYLRERQQRY